MNPSCPLCPDTDHYQNHHDQSYISDIPDEILDCILTNALATPPVDHPASVYQLNQNYRYAAWILCRVCRQFNRVATPLLYRYPMKQMGTSIGHDCNSPTISTSIRLLYRTLTEVPALRPLCRSVHIEYLLSGNRPRDHSIPNTCLMMLTNVTKLTCQIDRCSWPWLWQAPSILPMVKDLEITFKQRALFSETHEVWDPSFLGQILTGIKFSRLQRFALLEYRKSCHEVPRSPAHDFLRSVARHMHKSPIKALSLRWPRCASYTVSALIEWPLTLERLHVEEFKPHAVCPHSYDPCLMARLFGMQQSSLRHISVRQANGESTFAFTDFQRLETLCMQWETMRSSRIILPISFFSPDLPRITLDSRKAGKREWYSFDKHAATLLWIVCSNARKKYSSFRELVVLWRHPHYRGGDITPTALACVRRYRGQGILSVEDMLVKSMKLYWEEWERMQKLETRLPKIGVKFSYYKPDLSYEQAIELLRGKVAWISILWEMSWGPPLLLRSVRERQNALPTRVKSCSRDLPGDELVEMGSTTCSSISGMHQSGPARDGDEERSSGSNAQCT